MNYIFALAMFAISSTAHAEDPLRASSMTWKIIGLNTQSNIVAFKAVYTEEAEGGPILCNYPGVKEGEFVQLGAWNVAEQKVIQTWNVYPLPNKEGECAAEATTKATLQAAKDYYKAQNIDISKPPAVIEPQKDGNFAIPKKDKSNHVFVVVNNRCLRNAQ